MASKAVKQNGIQGNAVLKSITIGATKDDPPRQFAILMLSFPIKSSVVLDGLRVGAAHNVRISPAQLSFGEKADAPATKAAQKELPFDRTAKSKVDKQGHLKTYGEVEIFLPEDNLTRMTIMVGRGPDGNYYHGFRVSYKVDATSKKAMPFGDELRPRVKEPGFATWHEAADRAYAALGNFLNKSLPTTITSETVHKKRIAAAIFLLGQLVAQNNKDRTGHAAKKKSSSKKAAGAAPKKKTASKKTTAKK